MVEILRGDDRLAAALPCPEAGPGDRPTAHIHP